MNYRNAEDYVHHVHNLSLEKKYDDSIRLYAQSNENLLKLFSNYSIHNKEVLTVLASSDQAFSCFYLGAKSVDSFDRNYLTFYYYFLRKWLLLYQNREYASYHFFYDGDIELYELICSIIPTSPQESEAKTFWKKYMELSHYKAGKYLFYPTLCNQPTPYGHNYNQLIPFFNQDISFTCMNLLDTNKIQKKYDVVILSNMLEYTSQYNQLIHARDNVEKLLKDGGIAICSYAMYSHSSPQHHIESDIMTSHQLVFDSYYQYYEPLFGKKMDLSYSYKLKK